MNDEWRNVQNNGKTIGGRVQKSDGTITKGYIRRSSFWRLPEAGGYKAHPGFTLFTLRPMAKWSDLPP